MHRHVRVLVAALATVCVLIVAAAPVIGAPSPSDLEKAACGMTSDELMATWHGWRPDRGGQLMALPNEPNFVGGGLPHAGPWAYLQEIPMFWYGPGYIKPVGKIKGDAHLIDIAPTQAEILGFDGFTAPDGHVLQDILEPERARKDPPKLILTLIWDGAGRDVLDPWPNSWKTMQKLIPDGAWMENATVGSSPSDTPPSHASIGTGAWPNEHGVLDQTQELAGRIITPWGSGPTMLIRPTLADIYDRAMDNEPKIGGVASLGAHLGMVGHGSMWGGGDQDLAINRENLEDEGDEGLKWNLRPTIGEFFRFPKYVNKLPSLIEYNREVDLIDGAADGKWRGTPLSELRNGWDSPARVPYQSKVVDAVIKREKFGKDDVPDMLFVNYKTIDNIGHKFSADSQEMSDTVQAQDADLDNLIGTLDKRVGKGEWVMVITADHGAQRDPAITGAHAVSPGQLEPILSAKFPNIIKNIRPTELWIEHGTPFNKMVELSRFMMSLSTAELPDPDSAGGPEKMYETVFPASMMAKLPCLAPLLKKEAKGVRKQRAILEGNGAEEGPASEDDPSQDPGDPADDKDKKDKKDKEQDETDEDAA